MRYFTALTTCLLTLASSSWALTSLPNGIWTGSGSYHTSDGKSGTYGVRVTISNNHVTKQITHERDTYAIEGTASLDANGFGTLQGQITLPSGERKAVTSQLSCGEMTCNVWNPELRAGGTIAFVKDNLYATGTKANGNVKVRWEEQLSRLAPMFE